MTENARRMAGALAGGAVGIAGYWLLLRSGYHLIGVVGGGVALGVSAGARTKSAAWAVLTAVLAVGLSLITEWWFRPFAADPSFGYFLSHLPDLSRNSIACLFVVAALGLYLGRGKQRGDEDAAHSTCQQP